MKFTKRVIAMLGLAPLLVATFGSCQTAPPVSQAHIKTVFIILMENKNWVQILGSSSAPYINNTLLPVASHAELYFNPPLVHPSLPNYLWLEAGINFGIFNDDPPSANHQSTTQHLVTLLQKSGISWKTYQENIGGADCPLVSNGLYAVKHNPFVYFDDVTNNQDPIRPIASATRGHSANWRRISPTIRSRNTTSSPRTSATTCTTAALRSMIPSDRATPGCPRTCP